MNKKKKVHVTSRCPTGSPFDGHVKSNMESKKVVYEGEKKRNRVRDGLINCAWCDVTCYVRGLPVGAVVKVLIQ